MGCDWPKARWAQRSLPYRAAQDGRRRGKFGARMTMSRRVKRPLAKSRAPGDRPKGARPYRGSQAERSPAHRAGGKAARFAEPRREKPAPFVAEPAKTVAESPPLPTKVETVVVTADENN